MAMMDNYKLRDGITIGGPEDLCMKCEAERRIKDLDSDIPYGKLDYQEVFKIKRNGIETCICMDHLRKMINESSHYMLVDTDQYEVIPKAALDEVPEEVEEAPVEQKEVKKETKKAAPKKKANK